MEYSKVFGSYGRLTVYFCILLRSEILGSGIQDLDLDSGPGSGPGSDPETGPDWS